MGGKLKGITFTDTIFIKEVLEGLSFMVKPGQWNFEVQKRSQGGEYKGHKVYLRDIFLRLCKFLHDLPFSGLNNLTKPEENYFAGRIFLIAGIIEPFQDGLQYRNDGYYDEKDYLKKRMEKYRYK